MTPRHPAVVHFPIALTVLSVFADAAAWLTRGSAVAPSLFAAGWWTLVGAVGFGALAIVLGLSDMRRETIQPDAHDRVHHHMRVGFTLFVVLGLLFAWRLFRALRGELSVGGWYLLAAVIPLALVVYQGWLGGELVFRYGVGVEPTGQGGRDVAAMPDESAHAAHKSH